VANAPSALAATVFVAGGLYFGYIFMSTVIGLVEARTGIDLPNPPGVVASNPPPATTGNEPPVTAPPKEGERINVLLLASTSGPPRKAHPHAATL
jgi:hypothetical protein